MAWSPEVVGAALQVAALVLGAVVTVYVAFRQIRGELEQAREQRQHDARQNAYRKLIPAIVEQTMMLMEARGGVQVGERVKKMSEPLMEIHLFASPPAIDALMACSRKWAELLQVQQLEQIQRHAGLATTPSVFDDLRTGLREVIDLGREQVKLANAGRIDLGLSDKDLPALNAAWEAHFEALLAAFDMYIGRLQAVVAPSPPAS